MLDSNQRSHFISELSESLTGQRVSVAGWIEDVRDIGRLIFVTVRDSTGSIQAVARGPHLSIVKEIPRQSSVIVEGSIRKGGARDFPVEIGIEEISVASRAVYPLPIDGTGRVSSSLDKRIDSRPLDLRTPSVSKIFKLRSLMISFMRENLSSNGFLEVSTPRIIGTASEGGANLFSFEYFKRKAYLAQSPQLYKEELMVGLDRVFEIGPYFRSEKSHTVRHLTEFVSVDIEAAFVNYEFTMSILEDLVREVVRKALDKSEEKTHLSDLLSRLESSGSIEKFTYKQCLEELWNNGEKIEFGADLTDSSLRLLGEMHTGFYFITDWPTELKPFYIQDKKEDPELSESFDLQYGYLELASGGTRLHSKERLRTRIEQNGLRTGDFDEHLKVFDWGIPPHAGWGLGFDRLMMVLANSQNIREVVLFPRDVERLRP
ncbi:MAG: aspartate--tRNA(Asn) ligase [Thermoproteota archaeon]|nr:aspartate--tRNA(Asn) ligase [Thermoproteota archaeon]